MPTVENKVLERAVAMLLEPVYERELLNCSYGFRTGRSPHQALEAVRAAVMAMGGGWVLDVDVRKYFDTIPHQKLRDVIGLRIRHHSAILPYLLWYTRQQPCALELPAQRETVVALLAQPSISPEQRR